MTDLPVEELLGFCPRCAEPATALDLDPEVAHLVRCWRCGHIFEV